MYRLIILIVFLFVWTICEIVVIKKQKDKIYSGHVLFEVPMPMWSICAQYCSRVKVCKSINFIASTKTCQINDHEPETSECSGLVESIGNSFAAASTFPKELAGQCNGNKCTVNEACMPSGMNYYCDPLPFQLSENSAPSDLRPRDCSDLPQGSCSGVYTMYLADKKFDVYCDMDTAGFGWTVFQRRSDGSENFFRDWQAYEDGFGTILGEFWIGNKYLHILTQVPTELRIDLEAWDGQKRYAKYSSFVIGDADSKYTLSVDGFGGNAGDGLAYHHGLKFSTHDQDNTQTSTTCAATNKGAWWYKACSHSSLNGEYLKTNGRADHNMGINWEKFKGDRYSLKGSSMMLRRKT